MRHQPTGQGLAARHRFIECLVHHKVKVIEPDVAANRRKFQFFAARDSFLGRQFGQLDHVVGERDVDDIVLQQQRQRAERQHEIVLNRMLELLCLV
jgi:hypothetical protein